MSGSYVMEVPKKTATSEYFHEYFAGWMEVYKRGYVRPITFQKYEMTLKNLIELAPCLQVGELNKRTYQNLINEYAKTHEKQTTMDFHHHLKSAILDAMDEGLLEVDPTRKVVIKGKPPAAKKPKFLNLFELKALLANLNLTNEPNWDWLILLIAKTGLRFSEALALTPNDIDGQKIKITKTWNYKSADGGFTETKNQSSKRTLQIDAQLAQQLGNIINNGIADKPVFVNGRVFNSTVNDRMKTLCNKAAVPVISIHSLRHTHASLLIYEGVSLASVAKRLGHANTTTTQETYLHIVKELENKDTDKVLEHLSKL